MTHAQWKDFLERVVVDDNSHTVTINMDGISADEFPALAVLEGVDPVITVCLAGLIVSGYELPRDMFFSSSNDLEVLLGWEGNPDLQFKLFAILYLMEQMGWLWICHLEDNPCGTCFPQVVVRLDILRLWEYDLYTPANPDLLEGTKEEDIPSILAVHRLN